MKDVGEFKVNTGECRVQVVAVGNVRRNAHTVGAPRVADRPYCDEHIEVLLIPRVSLAWEGWLAGSFYDIIRMLKGVDSSSLLASRAGSFL